MIRRWPTAQWGTEVHEIPACVRWRHGLSFCRPECVFKQFNFGNSKLI